MSLPENCAFLFLCYLIAFFFSWILMKIGAVEIPVRQGQHLQEYTLQYGIRKWFSIGFQWFMCIYLLFRELCQILVTLVEM